MNEGESNESRLFNLWTVGNNGEVSSLHTDSKDNRTKLPPLLATYWSQNTPLTSSHMNNQPAIENNDLMNQSSLVDNLHSDPVYIPPHTNHMNLFDSSSTMFCRFFASGNCTRGENCGFVHREPIQALSKSKLISKPLSVSTASPSSSSTSSVSSSILSPPQSASSTPVIVKPVLNNSPSIAASPVPARKDSNANLNSPVCAFSNNVAIKQTISVEELPGKVLLYAKDQHGCRLLQRFLETQDVAATQIIYAEVCDDIDQLVMDPFGNYLCQKILDCCDDQKRLDIVSRVSDDLVTISLNVHGTRVVQKMIEVISSPEVVAMVIGVLSKHVVELTKDLNGNHVVQRCLHHLSSSDNQFIYDAISRHCVVVATHKHGCCVLQRCIDYATEQQREQIIRVVVENVLELVQDAFGNYVVQYVLDLGDAKVCAAMMTEMLGSISTLAVQKFSSNVIEKCLQIADPKLRVAITTELFHSDAIYDLIQDPFGNYVIQKALSVATPARFVELVAILRPHVMALKNTPFGKRIQSKLLKRFPALGQGTSAHSA